MELRWLSMVKVTRSTTITSYVFEDFLISQQLSAKREYALQCIDEEMRGCLSNIRHNIREVAKTHQAHVSHEHKSEST